MQGDRACRIPHLLHVLHGLQQQFRRISHEAMLEVAAQLDLPISQVQAVVEFYAFFSTTPRGRYDILFSNCTSCGYLAGGENLLQLLAQRLGITAGETRADGLVSIGETSCIGMCDHGASLLLNGQPLTRLDSAKIEHIAAMIEVENRWRSGPRTGSGWTTISAAAACCWRMILPQVMPCGRC